MTPKQEEETRIILAAESAIKAAFKTSGSISPGDLISGIINIAAELDNQPDAHIQLANQILIDLILLVGAEKIIDSTKEIAKILEQKI